MKNLAKLRVIATITGLFVAGMSVFAQSNYPDALGTYIAVPASAGEVTDTVAVGARMPYYVAPDATVDAAITSGFMNKSVFKWEFPGSVSVLNYNGTPISATNGYYAENEVSVEWSAVGSFTIKTTEKSVPKVGTGCEGSATTLSVVVQAVPTFAFDGTATGACAGGTTTFDLPITVSGSSPWLVSYTISNGTSTLTVTDQVVSNGNMPYASGVTTVPLAVNLSAAPLTGVAGEYTVTVTKVKDRITQKALNNATLAGTVDATKNTFKVGLIAAPTTQPIQHIRNL